MHKLEYTSKRLIQIARTRQENVKMAKELQKDLIMNIERQDDLNETITTALNRTKNLKQEL